MGRFQSQALCHNYSKFQVTYSVAFFFFLQKEYNSGWKELQIDAKNLHFLKKKKVKEFKNNNWESWCSGFN